MKEQSHDRSAPADLGESLAEEMAEAWARGERLPAEHYLAQCPELLEQPEELARLVYEEVCLRLERGEEVPAEELARRFPRWASELALMLDCHRLLQVRMAPPQFPEVGEALGDFQLLAELGRGIQGRVFLATQPLLADRPVVLKITPRQDREFMSLARLQHTHIIPLYGVHDFPARNLRVLCQPYFGGATLARLLDCLREVPPPQRSGRLLVETLDRLVRESPLPLPGHGPRETLLRMSYEEALCWIGLCLAEALHYAHERGLVHLDLKPSNVLLAADGQPLLLDFHLALHPVRVGQVIPEGMGGTLDYMSPEQRAAYFATRRGLAVPARVDRRSDVYSLGRLLDVVLGGEGATEAADLPPLYRRNPRVSRGLSDLIHRCLALDPGDRYPDAAALAADLRRHLANLPLHGVLNRSLAERWRKWRRRRPYTLLWASLLLALTGTAGTIGATFLERRHNAVEALREGQDQFRRGSYIEASRTLARGKSWAESVPGSRALAGDLDSWLRQSRRASALERLHVVTERLRLVAGTDPAERDLKALDAHCQAAWEVRALVAGRDESPLEKAAEEQARADLIDLALLWTELKQRLAPGNETARAEARAVLAEVEALYGPEAATLREPVALGRALLGAGELERAAEELERAVELRPQDFWAHFYRGICAYRQGQSAEAAQAFTVAVALAPRCAEVYYNRALARAACRETSAALSDYNRALEIDPTLAPASLNRGIYYYQQGRHAEAVADLERALQHGANPATAHFNLALVRLAQGRRGAALESVAQALQHAPNHPLARQLRERLQSEK